MSTFVALLRGINVGGKNVLPIRELASDLRALGLENVRTYIQSGNAVFEVTGSVSKTLPAKISARIEERHGFRSQVLIRSSAELQTAVDANPFPEAESNPKTLHVFFLASEVPSPDVALLDAAKSPSERFVLGDRVFYLHAPNGVARSKLAANTEKYLGVPVTARNWRIVQKLLEMTRAT
jgi:uncharacterized protein (DUF1697 family)